MPKAGCMTPEGKPQRAKNASHASLVTCSPAFIRRRRRGSAGTHAGRWLAADSFDSLMLPDSLGARALSAEAHTDLSLRRALSIWSWMAFATSLYPKLGAHECVTPCAAMARSHRSGSASTSAVGSCTALRLRNTSAKWYVSKGTT
eukprot:scaffold27982_cov31-Tisochrysis_lutea.AAC.14